MIAIMGYTMIPTCLTDEATGVLAEKKTQSFDNNLGGMDLSLKHGRLLWIDVFCGVNQHGITGI